MWVCQAHNGMPKEITNIKSEACQETDLSYDPQIAIWFSYFKQFNSLFLNIYPNFYLPTRLLDSFT